MFRAKLDHDLVIIIVVATFSGHARFRRPPPRLTQRQSYSHVSQSQS